jgi:hypothetical protein
MTAAYVTLTPRTAKRAHASTLALESGPLRFSEPTGDRNTPPSQTKAPTW